MPLYNSPISIVILLAVSFWSSVLAMSVKVMRIPLDTLAYGLNRIAEAVNEEPPPAVPAPPMELLPPLPKEEEEDSLRGDSLKLVRSRVVFVRRGDEYAFPAHETLVADDLEPGVFEAWKIAEFVQRMADPETAPEVPAEWAGYLPAACRHENGRLRRFPPGDIKYLRVYYEVLRRSRRERLHFHERQLRLLGEIGQSLRKPY